MKMLNIDLSTDVEGCFFCYDFST